MSEQNNKRAIGVAMALGFELLSLVLVGIFLGWYLGELKGFREIGAITGCVLAFTIWIWRVVSSKRHLL